MKALTYTWIFNAYAWIRLFWCMKIVCKRFLLLKNELSENFYFGAVTRMVMRFPKKLLQKWWKNHYFWLYNMYFYACKRLQSESIKNPQTLVAQGFQAFMHLYTLFFMHLFMHRVSSIIWRKHGRQDRRESPLYNRLQNPCQFLKCKRLHNKFKFSEYWI